MMTGPRRALLIEDADSDAVLLGHHLDRSKGWETTRLRRLTEALADPVRVLGGYHVILLDLGLPDSGGVDGVAHLCAATDAPVVVVSGRVGGSASVACIAAGACDVISKDMLHDGAGLEERLTLSMARAARTRRAVDAQRRAEAYLALVLDGLREPVVRLAGMIELLAPRTGAGPGDVRADEHMLRASVDEVLAVLGEADGGSTTAGLSDSGTMEACVSWAARLHGSALQRHGVTITVEGLPAVRADERELRMAFHLILDDVRERAAGGPVRIRVHGTDDGHVALVHVQDDARRTDPGLSRSRTAALQRILGRLSPPARLLAAEATSADRVTLAFPRTPAP